MGDADPVCLSTLLLSRPSQQLSRLEYPYSTFPLLLHAGGCSLASQVTPSGYSRFLVSFLFFVALLIFIALSVTIFKPPETLQQSCRPSAPHIARHQAIYQALFLATSLRSPLSSCSKQGGIQVLNLMKHILPRFLEKGGGRSCPWGPGLSRDEFSTSAWGTWV